MTSPDKPYILISFPKDMLYLCNEVRREFERLKETDIGEKELEIYSWNIDLDPFDIHHTKPPQMYIPQTSHKLCRGVICLFGETLGKPLNYPINHSDLGILAKELNQVPFPTFYPNHKQDNHNSFPITGSVFEILTTLKFNDDHNNEMDIAIPILIVAIGDESVLSSNHPDDFDWGNQYWKISNEERIKLNGNRREFHSWMNQEYYPEVQRLFNFIKYLHDSKGRRVSFEKDSESAIERIRRFLVDNYGNGNVSGTKPFKGLNAYSESDSNVFFGREKQIQDVLRKFSDLWDDPYYVPFFSIYGGSGVGKSSFLRAGIIARLKKKNHYGIFKPIVFLADELFNVNQPDKNPLLEMYLGIIIKLFPGFKIDNHFESRLLTRNPEDQALTVLEKLGEIIDSKIVIAIDQFEYLIDLRGDKEFYQKLTPLFIFFQKAVSSGKIGVIVTSQTNRLELMANDPILGEVWDNGGKKALRFTHNELEEIVFNGFAVSDLTLTEKEIETIFKEFSTFLDSKELNRDSLLPIVSNTLNLIYEKHKEKQLGLNKSETSNVGKEMDIDTINIEDSIDQLAENAISKVMDGPGWWDDKLVNTLLRKLVRIQGKKLEHIILLSAEVSDDEMEKKLVKSLKEFRLLVSVGFDQNSDRIQFVHEAVIRYWKRAFSWLTEESELLGYRSNAALDAISWEEKERSEDYLVKSGKINDYTKLLYSWFSYYHRKKEDLGEEDASIKEFVFSSLSAIEKPFTKVEGSESTTNHFLLAANYGRFNLVKKYIDLDKSVVHCKNSYDANAVYTAAFSKSIETLNLILSKGGSTSESQHQGWYPIHVASSLGDIVAFDKLIEYKADPLVRNNNNSDILHVVCATGDLTMLDHILKKKIPVNFNGKQKNNGWTPLHSAAYSSSSAIIERLVEIEEVNLNAIDDEGWTPLLMACRYADHSTITALIKSKIINYELKTNDGWSALHMACRYQDGFIVSEILKQFSKNVNEPTNVSKLTWKPLYLAIFSKSSTAVQALLKCSAIEHDYNHKADSPYELAIKQGAYDILEILWNDSKIKASEADHENRIAIFFDVIEKNQLDLIGITSNGMNILENNEKGTILHACVRSNSIETFQLLENVFDFSKIINKKDSNGNTALHLAAEKGNKKIILKLLQEFNPDILVNSEGKSVLHQIFGHSDVSDLLDLIFEIRPAWLHYKDQQRRNLLQLAIEKENLEVVELLLRKGLPLEHQDSLQQNALHFLAKTNNEALINMLTHHLSDPELVVSRNINGISPLHLCCHFGNLNVLERLPFQDLHYLTKGINPPLNPIEMACETGQEAVVSYILEDKGINFIRNSTDQPLLKLIILNGHYQWASSLLNNYPELGEDLKNKMVSQHGLIYQLLQENKRNPDPLYENICTKIWGKVSFQMPGGLKKSEQKQDFKYRVITIQKLNQKGSQFQITAFNEYEKQKSRLLVKQAKQKDNNTCQYCGFSSLKYMDVVVENLKFYDSEAYVTACNFCAQNFYLDFINEWRSGVLIWLPEVELPRLSHIMRDIYVTRISSLKPIGDMAREALDFLSKRRFLAEEKIGTHDPSKINDSLINSTVFKKNIRLMPIDRRIIKEAGLQFNIFPQSVAYWRSRQGPYSDVKNRKFHWLENFYNEFKNY
jgi:intracellular multiplication protein IcmJ